MERDADQRALFWLLNVLYLANYFSCLQMSYRSAPLIRPLCLGIETMDSFETLVGTLLEKDGFWVRTSVKVEITPEEKRKIGRPSSPRWELDLVAYKAKSNELLVVECKSFLDSPGVRARGLDGTDKKEGSRYKLFNDSVLRKTVLGRLVKQLVSSGACAPSPSVLLCLAAGAFVLVVSFDDIFWARGAYRRH